MLTYRAPILLLLTVAIVGVLHAPGGAQVDPPAVAAGAVGEVAAEAGRRAAVLATFTGGQVTVGEFEDAINNKPPLARARLATPEGRVGFLRELVDYELLILEAQARGYAQHRDALGAAQQAAIDVMLGQPVDIEDAVRIEAKKKAIADELRASVPIQMSPELLSRIELDRPRHTGLAGHVIIPSDPRAAPRIVQPEDEGSP